MWLKATLKKACLNIANLVLSMAQDGIGLDPDTLPTRDTRSHEGSVMYDVVALAFYVFV